MIRSTTYWREHRELQLNTLARLEYAIRELVDWHRFVGLGIGASEIDSPATAE